MIYALLAVLAGLYLLVISADKFVDNATDVAYRFGISPFIIGITIVAFGTSAPEMVVSAIAAWYETPNIAIGNAIGSNIANMGLVLGITALLVPLPFKRSLLSVDIPILILGSLLAGWVLWDLQLGLLDSLMLLTALVISFYFLMRNPTTKITKTTTETATAPATNAKTVSETTASNAQANSQWVFLWLIISIAVMILSARMLVWGASFIATALGVSDLIIGLTIVAIGTSLPELATSIASIYKKQYDIAIGNIIGSNTFNILAVMAIPGLIHPTTLSVAVLWRDYGTMLLLTLLLLGFGLMAKKNNTIGRIKGSILVVLYAGYNVMLYLSA